MRYTIIICPFAGVYGDERENDERPLPVSASQDNVESHSLTSSVALQILDLVHQLDVQLAKSTENLKSKMEMLEHRMESVENSLNGKITETSENLETKMEALKERLEDKIAAAEKDLQGNIVTLQNRLEDKIEERVVDKLGRVHVDVETFTKNAKSYSEGVRKSLDQSVTAIGESLNTEQQKAITSLNYASQILLDNHYNVTETLLETATNLTRSQTEMQNELVVNLGQAVQGISESGANISKLLTEDVTALEQELQGTLQQLLTNLNQSVAETMVYARSVLLASNATAETVKKDLELSTQCRRTDQPNPPPNAYPYPVIDPVGSIMNVPFLCDRVTDGGGWVIIQRRSTGNVDFYRNWEEYKTGFGDLTDDFYLGNENIHRITTSAQYELRVDLSWQGKLYYAKYSRFSLASEAENYRLTVGGYSGTAGDSLVYHNGLPFSTKDRDNDNANGSCAQGREGAWWYDNCCKSNLNGRWGAPSDDGPWWYHLSSTNPVAFTEMKVRRVESS